MKITVKEKIKQTKHEVGKAYKYKGMYYLVIMNSLGDFTEYALLCLNDSKVSTIWFDSLELLDKSNSDDIEVDLEITIDE